MYRSKAQSVNALAANALVEDLQYYFVEKLKTVVETSEQQSLFDKVEWFRDQGLQGGGMRYVVTNERLFNRGSINVSQIHYEDDSSKNLASATALSTIIHPENPFAPSVHMHISWTEMKNGEGYWRIMADLNPAIESEADRVQFESALEQAAPEQYELAAKQGALYFYIPALERHRGVSHFYLEQYASGSTQADFDLASKLGRSVIDKYVELILQAIQSHPSPSKEEYNRQLSYHTLYLFQVLTLDRGTTSGLLVHNQNDLGIMGSLPAQIDKSLLSSWKDKLEVPQDELLQTILDALPETTLCRIDNKTKLLLAEAVRQHYKLNPEGLSMQAQGYTIPPTVENHVAEK